MKLTSIFVAMLSGIILLSCSTEELRNEESRIVATSDVGQRNSNLSVYECVSNPPQLCIPSFPYEEPKIGEVYNSYEIIFSSHLTVSEIECLRQAYFTCIPELRRYPNITVNPYKDTWYVPANGKPGGELEATTDDDPDVCYGSDCDD